MTVYLDHGASTPMRPEAVAVWTETVAAGGNPSSVHGHGRRARRILEDARDRVAAAARCEPVEVVFTSGGTEAVNLAVKGLWWARASGDAVVLPDGEHHATLETVGWLARHEHAEVRRVPLDPTGRIDADAFAAALPDAAVATALTANNEVGTVNDAAGLAASAGAAGVPLHLDAVASFGRVPVDFARWRGAPVGGGLVAMSLSAHKIGGPVGIGALVVSRHARLGALVHGGAAQRDLRAGTQDAAAAAAFGVAAELAVGELATEAVRLRVLTERLARDIRDAVPTAEILGDPIDRLPGTVHVLFPGALGESLLYLLDRAGVSVSTGAACQAGVAEPSHVVLAMGRSERDARSVLRFTLGRTSTDADVEALLAALPDAHRRASGASREAATARRSP